MLRCASCTSWGLLLVIGSMVVPSSSSCRNDVDTGRQTGEGEGEGDVVDDPGPDGEGEGEGDCPHAGDDGLHIRLTDDRTQLPVCNATVRVSDGAYSENATASGGSTDCGFDAARDRPGTYLVDVTADGYQPFSLPDNVVRADPCGDPIRVVLPILLTPQ